MTTEELLIIWVIAWIMLLITYYSYKSKSNEWKMPDIRDGIPTKWNWIVRYPHNLHLGENTDIGAFTYIQAKNKVTIGKNVKIGAHCAIYTENTIDETSCEIIIEENARIGASTIILPKTGSKLLTIGKNSVIGACSLVKDNIPPDSISFGTPAKLWKYNSVRKITCKK